MRAHKTKRKPKTKQANIDKLIQIEWDIINDLKRMLTLPYLEAAEKVRVGNSLAYHVTVLNKLLTQKGESSQFNDESLCDFIRGIEPKIAHRIRVDFKEWTRKLSSIRYSAT